MKRIYAEIGFGNDTFISTEFSEGEEEYRVPKFIKPKKIDDFYLRFWFLKRVIIFSTKDKLVFTKKKKIKFKLIFGIAGPAE